ncbi:hypothetical protein V2J09_019120 [Rumex salicifolius]
MAKTTAGETADPPVRNSECLLFPCLRRDRVRTITFLKQFTFKELKRATDDFRRVVSNHSQGISYEARFLDNSVCIVKERDCSDQAKDDFLEEVQLLASLHHRHLVPLIGYSIGPRSFLVFEATGQGSLKQHLNDPLKTPLNWKKRLQIALGVAAALQFNLVSALHAILGVAAALEYLHLFCDPPVYHVSISSSDIILDEKFTAKLSDISILPLRLFSSSDSEGSQQLPRNLISKFGALLLELITGQASEKGSGDVIEWVQESHLDVSMHNMIDPDLGNSYDSRMLRHLLTVARLCIQSGEKPSFSMSHVFWYLQAKILQHPMHNKSAERWMSQKLVAKTIKSVTVVHTGPSEHHMVHHLHHQVSLPFTNGL